MELKEGDKIWVVQEWENETNLLAIPMKPQSGTFLKIDMLVGVMVFVDNDLLYVSKEEVFLDENSAWKKWHERMNAKIAQLQDEIDKAIQLIY